MRYMGVDGGGSLLRVVIIDDDVNIIGEYETRGGNPSAIGRQSAAALIVTAVHRAMADSKTPPDDIAAVCLGIAGAAADHARDYVRGILGEFLPDTVIVPSSDLEIALVGAHGRREGVLLLSGTGSGALGVNPQGDTVRVGGWGYLLGDEGSGYWIGNEALKAITHGYDRLLDGAGPLSAAVLGTLGLDAARDLIAWLYRTEASRVPDVAALAPLVMRLADEGDTVANGIIDRAADHLTAYVPLLQQRLNLSDVRVAFAGGLLANDTTLSRRVCQRLSLSARPVAQYNPAVGAAILARDQVR